MNSAKKQNLMSAMRTFVSHLSFLITPPHPFTSFLIPLLLLLVAAGEASATGVRMRHDIVLKSGWNAFYLPVTLDESADAFFADWPTDCVGCYDQAAYLRTEQFTTSADESTQGAIEPRIRHWVRGESGRSTLRAVVGNAVYLVCVTNKEGFAKTVYGEPVALRMDWHRTTGDDCPLNYLGISTDGADAQMTDNAYLLGLNTDWETCYTVCGRPTLAQPNLTLIDNKDPSVTNFSAVAMDARKTGDWSGPLYISPANGFDLGTNGTMGVLKVRNDSGTNRTVRIHFKPGEVSEDPLQINLPFPKLQALDPARQSSWNAEFAQTGYERELVAGEILELRLAVDRETELLGPSGTEYGGVITVTDVSPENCSHFQTSVPFSAKSDGGEFRRTKWPKGLWAVDVTLDKVSQMVSESSDGSSPTPVKAGAPMKLRLLLHVDSNGAMNLVQRARLGTRRVSAAALPTDQPILPGEGTFGVAATFNWSVAETSRVNPFYHARHPDHDGLKTDFKSPAPSGDDFNNYNSTVKPELFSVENAVAFAWNATTGAAWNPEETLSGTCSWTLTGLRREGGIETTGTFTMKRLSALDLDELKEDF